MNVLRIYQGFKRQTLPSCVPHIHKRTLGVVVIALSFACIGLGAYILRVSDSVTTVTLPYSELCERDECELTLNIAKPMNPPVFMFYKLDGFYQNERAYVKSRSDKQLAGEFRVRYGDLKDCEPVVSRGGSTRVEDLYYPCGSIAKTFFNDTFSVSKADSKTPVGFNKHGIAWGVERHQLFRQLEQKFPGIYTVESVTDEDFIIWMRVAALPNFMKLHRIYDSKRPLHGKYVVRIKNTYKPAGFTGKKSLVFTTLSPFGLAGPALAATSFILSAVLFVSALVVSFNCLDVNRKQTKTK